MAFYVVAFIVYIHDNYRVRTNYRIRTITTCTCIVRVCTMYTAPIKYLNTYKWSDLSEPEIVCNKIIN